MSSKIPPVNPEFGAGDIEPLVFKRLREDPIKRPWYFCSLRWQVVLPLTLLIMLLAALGAYVLGDAAARNVQDREIDRLLEVSVGVSARMLTVGNHQRQEATRVAYTAGVAAGIEAGDSAELHALLEPLARAGSEIDTMLAVDAAGDEIVGLQRVTGADGVPDYAVAAGSDLGQLPEALRLPGAHGSRALLRTTQGYALSTSVPVLQGDQIVGAVLVGTRIDGVLADLRGGEAVDLALYGADQAFIRTTLPFDDTTHAAFDLAPSTFEQALSTPGAVPVRNLTLEDSPYNVAYLPWLVDDTPLGVVAVYRADETLYTTWLSRELLAVMAAALVAVVAIAAYFVMEHFTRRLEVVQQAAHALASGDAHARTTLRVSDEISELGATLDQLAERQQRRTDNLQTALRQQRVETARLSAILESIPEGLVVQDLDGRVLLINAKARDLLGGQRVFRATRLHELTEIVHEKLGGTLAPGIYALGDPTRLSLDGRLLQAQAAALTLQPDEQRIGTVIVLRDITTEVLREQRREELLDTLAQQALAPRSPAAYESLSTLAREVVHNTRAIQHVILELRDLSTFEPGDLASDQQPLLVDQLLHDLGTDWSPAAEKARVQLQVLFGLPDKYILGDERRLRWAIGNVIDNSITFSPPRTTITLAGRAQNTNVMEIIVKDQGYGIASEDVPHVFTRFYRGSPRDYEGQKLRKPGTGQGLFIARRIIEAHGGQIELASRLGVGTTVLMRLPLTAGHPLTTDHTAFAHTNRAGDTVPLNLPKYRD